MILPIVSYGSDVLRQVAQTIDLKNMNCEQLVQDMFDTMYNASGVGLAAPQIGKSLSIFVMDSNPLTNSDEAIKMIFINPEITSHKEEETTYAEGCLSIPDISKKVRRPSDIIVKYQDINGKWYDKAFSGINARIIQHEYDHLVGKLFIDYLSLQEKLIIKNKLAKIASGKYKTDYPMLAI